MTTFDRHLLFRFLHAFCVFFIAALGLYVVIDGFTNLDDFQHATRDQGVEALLWHMAQHYACHTCMLFELMGPTAATMGVTATLTLMSKHGELHPLLAAGVPTYRLTLPFVMGMTVVNGLLIANQELLVPIVAPHLQGNRSHRSDDARLVEPCLSTEGIFISGQELFLSTRRLIKPEFRIQPGTLASEYVTLSASVAYHFPADEHGPAGWVLKGAKPRFHQLNLTDAGRRIIIPQAGSADLFIVTDVSLEELYNRNASFKFLSTSELLTRVSRPSLATGNALTQLLHLHGRFTRPIMLYLGIFMVFPVILRKESYSLVSSVGLCTLMLATVFGATQTLRFIGQSGLISPELATWLPLIGSAGLSAWLSPLTKT